MNAYDKIYFEDAVHNFGVMVDCAVNTIGCSAEQFWNRFLASSVAGRFSYGAVDIITGHSGVELALMVMNETGRKISSCNPVVSISSREYWAGATLARYQWNMGLPFSELTARGLGLTQTIAMFNPLHEADQTTFERVADDLIGKVRPDNSWLKRMRKTNGYTQEQLSVKSGVPVRLVRAYEQGKINLSNAEYGTIIKLRAALNCTEFHPTLRDVTTVQPYIS